MSFIGTIMDGLLPSGGRVAPVLLDLMGYDASPAKYVMNKLATGVKSKIHYPPNETNYNTRTIDLKCTISARIKNGVRDGDPQPSRDLHVRFFDWQSLLRPVPSWPDEPSWFPRHEESGQ